MPTNYGKRITLAAADFELQVMDGCAMEKRMEHSPWQKQTLTSRKPIDQEINTPRVFVSYINVLTKQQLNRKFTIPKILQNRRKK
jgi:hypothetical protein